MALTNAVKEAAALAVTAMGGWVSVHTADPGSTGASEATGGAPAYARQQTTYTGGAADGAVAGSQVTIDLPAGTYPYVGLWTAQTGGTFLGGVAVTSVTLSAQGQMKITPTVTIS